MKRKTISLEVNTNIPVSRLRKAPSLVLTCDGEPVEIHQATVIVPGDPKKKPAKAKRG